MKSGLILSISGLLMIIAFSPKTLITDDQHYQYRMAAETAFMAWAFWRARQTRAFSNIEYSFTQYWLMLFSCSLYDDIFGDPCNLTSVELSIAISVTVYYLHRIIKQWNSQK